MKSRHSKSKHKPESRSEHKSEPQPESQRSSPSSGFDWRSLLQVIGCVTAVGGIALQAVGVLTAVGGLAHTVINVPSKDRFEERREVYDKLASAATSFANANTMNDAQQASKDFTLLYEVQFKRVRDDISGPAADRFYRALMHWHQLHQSAGDKFRKPGETYYFDPERRKECWLKHLSKELSDACGLSLKNEKPWRAFLPWASNDVRSDTDPRSNNL